ERGSGTRRNERNFEATTVINSCESIMNDLVYDHLRDLSWRRKLTTSEELQLRAWLAAHPEAQSDWEDEARLNEMLRLLPDAPMPNNFTARVLQAAKRDEASELRLRGRSRVAWWRRLVTRTALAGLVG